MRLALKRSSNRTETFAANRAQTFRAVKETAQLLATLALVQKADNDPEELPKGIGLAGNQRHPLVEGEGIRWPCEPAQKARLAAGK
ncbi:MAG: hypothetical protein ACK4NH_08455 [Gemmobacter sp.]